MIVAEVVLCVLLLVIRDENGLITDVQPISKPTADITACVLEGIRIDDEMGAVYKEENPEGKRNWDIEFRILRKKDVTT